MGKRKRKKAFHLRVFNGLEIIRLKKGGKTIAIIPLFFQPTLEALEATNGR